MSDPARVVEEIRAIFAAFDWEQDDRQYALETIERIVRDGDKEPEPEPDAAGMSLPVHEHPVGRSLFDIRERLESATADLIGVIRALNAEPRARSQTQPNSVIKS